MPSSNTTERIPLPFAARRLQRLAREKERLLDLYLHEGIDRNAFMERKARIEGEILDLEAKMGDQTQTIQQARELIFAAVKLARNCYSAYRKASPETKKLWNQALFAEMVVRNKKILKVTYQEPFRTLLGIGVSNKTLLVEVSRHYQNRFPLLQMLLSRGAA